MKAIFVKDPSHELVLHDVPSPQPGPDDVLIEVRATAVNRADLLQRRGFYPPPPGESDILGLEAAGVVAAVGARAMEWRPGDRVCCLLGGGGYAEYVAVHRAMVLPIPAALSFEEAAAIPEAFYTAYVNLFLEGDLRAGEGVLIHAGGSGVGTAAIQLTRHAGARVIVTAGSADKIERCIRLGADAGINYKEEDFAERVAVLTDRTGIDVVLDCVGASYLAKHVSLLRMRGRLVIIGLMGGTSADIDLAAVVRKRLRVVGSVLRSRSLAEKMVITEQFKQRVLPLFERGEIKPVIDSVYPLSEAAKAHDRVAANLNFGKVVLRVSD